MTWEDGLQLLPEHMRDGVKRYIDYGVPGGPFMTACFENSLVDAYGRADSVNELCMKNWAEFLYWHAPSECWRSREKVDAWIKRGGLNGVSALTAVPDAEESDD